MLHRGAQEGIGGLWHTVATFGALEPCQNDSQRAGEHAEGSGSGQGGHCGKGEDRRRVVGVGWWAHTYMGGGQGQTFGVGSRDGGRGGVLGVGDGGLGGGKGRGGCGGVGGGGGRGWGGVWSGGP